MNSIYLTGRGLFLALLKFGIILTPIGDRLTFNCPDGAMTPNRLEAMKARKVELLAIVRGDYLHAASALLLDEPDTERRTALAEEFDERAGIGQYDAGLDRGTAERSAYVHLCRTIEEGTHTKENRT